MELLKNAENLGTEPNRRTGMTPREHPDKALSINEALATAYYFKDALKEIWNQVDERLAKKR